MAQQKRKFTCKEWEHIAQQERDYARFTRLADPASGDLSPKDLEWMSSNSVRYLAKILAIEDCYKNFTTHGIRQGEHSIDWWEEWLRTLTEVEVDNELLRIRVRLETEIRPWLAKEAADAI
jgi:hypothetical protein